MNIGKLILHFNTPNLTAAICKVIPDSIIIDNGSKDNNFLSELGNEIIRFEDNLGFTANWNRAIKKVLDRFDVFWLMNSDIVITKACVKRIEDLMNKKDIHVLSPSFNCWTSQCRNHETNNIREVKYIELTAPVIRKDVFMKIGFFDERFTLGYGCDFDFCYKALYAGFKIFVDDKCSFKHLGQKSITQVETINSYKKKAVFELEKWMTHVYGTNWRVTVCGKLELFEFLRHKNKENMKIAVYTTIFGGYSKLYHIPKQSIVADYFCVTDELSDKFDYDHLPETPEPVITISMNFPQRNLHPRMRAKYFKMFPWEVKELEGYDISIYLDGSIQITSPEFIRHCINSLGNHDMLLFKHPQRDCIYEEAKASIGLVKYKDQNISGQINEYRRIYPSDHAGLYACGIMVRKMNSVNMKKVMEAWWWENIKWSCQDQISLPVICHLLKFKPVIFPDHQINNEFFKIHWHDDKPDKRMRK